MSDMDNVVSFWKRALALLIDLMVINLVIIYPFRGIFARYFSNMSILQSVSVNIETVPSNIYFALFFISLLALLYFSFFDYYLGQSPGKMLLKIKVISLKERSGKIGLWSALLRNCWILPFFPFYVFWIIEPIYLAFYKEGFLERITFTKTVYEYDSGKKYGNRYNDLKLSKV
jgi:uncharacterized RDD family membrane protein YckC